MAQVGYKRVSSADQNTARQLDGVNLDEIFEDQVSGATTERPALQEMLRFVRRGDIIHVHSIDRFARSLKDLLELVESLKTRGVQLHFHKEGLIFTNEKNHTQDLMLSMMGAVAQFERSMIRERQAEGIAKAKAAGVYRGRKKIVDGKAIRAAISEGSSFRQTAQMLGVSLSSVQRAMRDQSS
ncbi:recombinase family protein [Pseudomonas mosselii]|uniref:recombinase family protein n=1 Tax=Pseudomonas mosselii TaxID=78327 RepID=UPI0018D76250|nr:recombinase family protein [Pseudomonas mosselii]MBH3308507.1 recombinase family protein [Pseudomonas mosselii]MBH3325407.1 recombinase family protein [Pseudomonas mosselii]